MPYIKKSHREPIDTWIHDGVLKGINITDPGVLNYIITQLLLESHPHNYENYNKLIGVLECCKMEFYRRAVATYENGKININGDVYPSRSID